MIASVRRFAFSMSCQWLQHLSACENETTRCISTLTHEDEESGLSSSRRHTSETANCPLRPGNTSPMYGYNEAKVERRWGKSTIHLRSEDEIWSRFHESVLKEGGLIRVWEGLSWACSGPDAWISTLVWFGHWPRWEKKSRNQVCFVTLRDC